MAYATSAEYQTSTGQTPPADINLLLNRASRLVDQALICAVYKVEDGLPTDPDHITAFREATIEQTAAWVGGGEDGTGAADQYASVSIGSVTLARKQGSTGTATSAARGLCPQAAMVLKQVGLTGHEPYTYPLCADG